MKEKKNQSEKNKHDLRKRAEELLTGQSENLDELSKTDIKGLIHELRVHQIELEMQNEELRRAQLELQDSQDKYVDLYDFAPVGYFTLNELGIILEVNLTGAALLGIERRFLIGRRFSQYIDKENHELFYLHRKRLLESTTRQACEMRMLRGGGTPFYAQLESTAVFNEGRFRHFRVAMLDITGSNTCL